MNLSGPVIRNRMTVTFGFGREMSEQGDTLRAVTPRGLISDAITRPTYERGLSLRSTMQLNENHALTFSFSHETERSENDGVGGFSLPEQGSRQITRDMSFQIQQTSVLTPKINNEVRLQIGAESDETVPLSSQPHIVVPDAFRGGGSTERGSSADREIGFGNLLMYTGESISIKTGFDGSYQMDGSDSRNNFNGTFTFGSLEDYLAGRPLQYSVNQGDPLLDIRQFEWAGFLQTDFRVTPRWTMGFGIRYEAQTNLDDRNNIDPRFGFAYHLGGATVLRGGTGVFHERVPVWQFQNLLRFDGERQRTVIIRNPSFPDPFQEGEQTVQVPSSVRARSGDLAAPYTWNSEASIETTLAIGLILTGSYQFVRGVHLIRGRNVNAPMDVASPVPRSCSPDQAEQACVRPQPDRGNIVEMESTGLSSTQEIRAGFQQRLRFINIRGNYTARFAYSNTSGPFDLPADNYDMSSEWGPVSPRHSVNTSLNLRLPWTVDADMMFNWNSGEPYSIVTGRDDNRDTNTTDRPAGVHRNSLWGPSFFEMDMNLSKTLSLFPEPAEETGPLAGGGYFGRRTGSRVTFSAEVRNLLNTVNYDRISGVITSPFFRMPTRARDGRSVSLSVRFDF